VRNPGTPLLGKKMKMLIKTKHKILIAKLLSYIIILSRKLLGQSHMVQTIRNGVRWNLDLREGIDLAMYLGVYERLTFAAWKRLIKPGFVVLDIGANIGVHTLPIASLVGEQGRVIAFEPTKYAFQKLKINRSLNPKLMSLTEINQVMLRDTYFSGMPSDICSSWPLFGKQDVHTEHCGRLRSTEGCSSLTLDSFLENRKTHRVDLIKLDVDGYEFIVLSGAEKTLKCFRPMIVMEISISAYNPENAKGDLRDVLQFFETLRYEMELINNGKKLPLNSKVLADLIPLGAGFNVLLKPVKD